MYRLLHITIAPASTPIDAAAIIKRLDDLGSDWIQYTAMSWILWTNKSVVTVSEMLATHLGSADYLLVAPINPAEPPAGRLPKWMWDWINRPRDNYTGEVRTPLLPAPAAKNYFDSDNPWLAALLASVKDEKDPKE